MTARKLAPVPLTQAIDVAETRWAASELTSLIERLGEHTVPGIVLRQAQQELASLIRGTDEEKTIVGPLRLRRAA